MDQLPTTTTAPALKLPLTKTDRSPLFQQQEYETTASTAATTALVPVPAPAHGKMVPVPAPAPGKMVPVPNQETRAMVPVPAGVITKTVSPAVAAAPKMQLIKVDRTNVFSASDDTTVIRQVIHTHAPDGRDIDSRSLLYLVEDILQRATPTVVLVIILSIALIFFPNLLIDYPYIS